MINRMEKMDFEDLDDEITLGRGSKHPSKKNPENVSEGEVLGGPYHSENMNPEDLMIDKEENPEKYGSGSVLVKEESVNPSLEPEPMTSEDFNKKEKEENLTPDIEEPKIRSAIASTKSKYNDVSALESHGKRGREHKGKYKKGMDTIKKWLGLN